MHMKPTLASRVTLSPEVLAQEMENETVLLDLASERYYGLDSVGSSIWKLLAAHETLDGAYRAILAVYDVAPGQLERDLLAIVDELAQAGLLEVE